MTMQNGNRSGGQSGKSASNTVLAREYKGGVFDLVPKLGYREYWHAGILAKHVGRKPRALKVLGSDIVFFRDTNNKVVALADYCAHRGARLSGGQRRVPGGGPSPGKLNDEFKGFITCPYHGSVYDGTGQCVAMLTDGPDSRLVKALKVRAYPTHEVWGVVFVWMGETGPVPIEEDVPDFFFDPDFHIEPHVRLWDMNWTLSIENSQDSHEGKIHRWGWRRVWNLQAFGRAGSYWGGCRLVEEGPNFIRMIAIAGRGNFAQRPQKAFYPGINSNWPKHTWWRRLPRLGRLRMQPIFDLSKRGGPGGVYQLPAIASPGATQHWRWAVAVTEDVTRMWTFTLMRRSFHKGVFGLRWLGLLWYKIFYNTWYLYSLPQGVNELEDMPVQGVGCLDPDQPQTLGPSDGANAFWRRRMPLKSRDYQRVWSKQAQRATSMEVAEEIVLSDSSVSAG